jgi:hypothetical protein
MPAVYLTVICLAHFMHRYTFFVVSVAFTVTTVSDVTSKERVYIFAGRESGELEGHSLAIFKVLYGLQTKGLRWHERFADCLRDMGFTPSKAEPDIWMRPNGDAYEYLESMWMTLPL